VIIGRHSRSSGNEDDSETIAIKERIRHPDYNENAFPFDIMILQLKNKSTKPYVKLNQFANVPEDGGELHVIGFGDATTASSLVLPTRLQEVEVDYVTNKDCMENHGSSRIKDDMLCASKAGKDSWCVR
jgi:secreted trypsin-like serine protease